MLQRHFLIALTHVFYLIFLWNCSKKEELTPPEITITGELDFSQTVGGSKNDVLKSIIKTDDGGYAILGYTQSNDGDIGMKEVENFDFWILKYDVNNNLIWQQTFGGSKDDRGADLINTSDGGFALLGYSNSSDNNLASNAGSQDFWVLKLSPEGEINWQKTFGFSGRDYGTTLLETEDGGFLITGVIDVSASNGQGIAKNKMVTHAEGDFWALKIDAAGILEWSNYYGGSFTDTPLGVVATADNGFIVAGSSDSNDVDITDNKGSYDFWVIKISSDGTLVWDKSFGGSEIDEARAICSTHDGNFMVVGDTRSSDSDITINNGGADVWILKISSEGNLIWEQTIGGASFDVARSISMTQDHGFVIAGSSRSSDYGFTNQGQNDALVLKIDAEGVLEWQQTVGGSEIDFLYDAIELNDKTIIAVGESNSSDGNITINKGFSDALILKIK